MKNRKSTTFNLHCFKAFESISSELVKTFTVDRGEVQMRILTDY